MPRKLAEFAELLTPRGRRVLEGRDRALCGAVGEGKARFVAAGGLLDRDACRRLLARLERTVRPALTPMADPIPAWTVRAMEQNYAELLPKTVRVQTAMLESRRARAYRLAEQVGLVDLLRSSTFHAFAEALCGQPLRRGWGIQALCYGPGDYAGPHNDHHPEEPDAKDGYLDLHVSLSTPAVAHQWLVYEQGGHLSQMQRVNTLGGVTAYRLPFWHYTTPLWPRPQQETNARRWVLLGTFLFNEPAPTR
jgi:hypothetical protein